MKDKIYDYVIIGAGISGCSVAFELLKHTKSVLLIDKRSDVAQGASGAAGAFLSPLLGKPNVFKNIITNALRYSTKFYKDNMPFCIDNCGTIRIPKNKEDKNKFESYAPFMDFEYKLKDNGYLFKIGSIVHSYLSCRQLSSGIEKLLDYEVNSILFQDDAWIINSEFKSKNIILTTGSSVNLIDELYINIKPIWGQKINIKTSTCIDYNYHKECSISRTIKQDDNSFIASIGATHNRNILYKEIDNNYTKELLNKASNILHLKDISVIQEVAGARACSVDYLPIVGQLINSEKTIDKFPHLKNGTHMDENKFIRYDRLYILNGLGGRGFVLAPYLAKILVDFIFLNKNIEQSIRIDRFFKRWVRKI
ncbi:FAD dependent oxidoreductase [hydrothermal vent metagenome]|uniref:FAD dependent oxidoreductase n=1 Tax=hydrothermal vent metagenome TaxID=652676 RepID=A0A3B1EA37_9ZZZZ